MRQRFSIPIERLNIAGALLLVCVALAIVLAQRKTTLWDFYSYYGAAKAVQAGADPYFQDYFNKNFPEQGFSVGPHAYPPLTLFVLKPLAFLSPAVGAFVWCILKLMALFLTGWIVQRRFFSWVSLPYALPFLLLGFNAAFYWDLVSGNISVIEQLFIWCALAALMVDRPAIFTAIIVVASQIKLPPVLFLGLLLVYDQKPKWAHFLSGAASFFLLYQLNSVLYPEFTREFLEAAHRLSDERGVHSASSMILIRELVSVGRNYLPAIPGQLDNLIYGAFLLVIGTVSALAVFRYKAAGNFNRVVLIFFFCITYGVVMPRLKSYQYALLLFPTLYLVAMSPRYLVLPLLLALVMFPHPGSPFPGPVQKVIAVCFEYFTIVTLYVVWVGYLFLMRQGPTTRSSSQ